MLKATGRRAFSSQVIRSFRYNPLRRVDHNPSETNLKYYKVQFHSKPLFSRLKTAAFYLVGPVYIWSTFIRDREDETEQVEDKDGAKNGVKNEPRTVPGVEEILSGQYDDEEDEIPMFIPCTWPEKGKRMWYKSTDPEWQEYVKFSKNKDRQNQVVNQLISDVQTAVTRNMHLMGHLGNVDDKAAKHWLDITYPYGPPIEYEYSGLEIGDEIRWTTRQVSQVDYNKILRTLTPVPAAASLWQSSKHMFGFQLQRVKSFFGQEPTPQSPNGSPTSATSGPPQPVLPPAPPAGSGAPPSLPTVSHQSPESTQQSRSSSPRTKAPTINVPDGAMNAEKAHAKTISVFLQNFHKWKPKLPIEPPRGSIVFTGLIEVKGSKARITLDVTSAYDPVADRFLFSDVRLRRLSEYNQRPRG